MTKASHGHFLFLGYNFSLFSQHLLDFTCPASFSDTFFYSTVHCYYIIVPNWPFWVDLYFLL